MELDADAVNRVVSEIESVFENQLEVTNVKYFFIKIWVYYAYKPIFFIFGHFFFFSQHVDFFV